MQTFAPYALVALIGTAGTTMIASPHDGHNQPVNDLESKITLRANTAINLLSLDRTINLTATGIALLVGIIMSVGENNALLTAGCYGVAIYNALRAMQRHFALQDLEEIKKIIHNHATDASIIILRGKNLL